MNWLNEMYVNWMNTVKSEKGQTIVEYALLLVLIAIVVIAMIKGIGGNANNTFSSVNSALQQ
jgi:pilus assembly protein Flp/PilA